MGKEYLSEEGANLQKKIRKIIWTIGGIGAAIIGGIGVYVMLDIPVLGLFVIGGLIPFELLLTYLATQCFSVKTEYVVCGYTIERDSNLTLVKSEDKGKEREKVRQDVEFTEIKPAVHLEIVNSNNKGEYSRKRIMNNNKK